MDWWTDGDDDVDDNGDGDGDGNGDGDSKGDGDGNLLMTWAEADWWDVNSKVNFQTIERWNKKRRQTRGKTRKDEGDGIGVGKNLGTLE